MEDKERTYQKLTRRADDWTQKLGKDEGEYFSCMFNTVNMLEDREEKVICDPLEIDVGDLSREVARSLQRLKNGKGEVLDGTVRVLSKVSTKDMTEICRNCLIIYGKNKRYSMNNHK